MIKAPFTAIAINNYNVICPFCGNVKIKNLSEKDSDIVETKCERCKKIYIYKCYINVKYDSIPISREEYEKITKIEVKK